MADIIHELQSYRVQVDLIDPYADAEEIDHEYNIELKEKTEGTYDAIIVAVAHREYREMTELDFLKLAKGKCLLVDVKGILKPNVADGRL